MVVALEMTASDGQNFCFFLPIALLLCCVTVGARPYADMLASGTILSNMAVDGSLNASSYGGYEDPAVIRFLRLTLNLRNHHEVCKH